MNVTMMCMCMFLVYVIWNSENASMVVSKRRLDLIGTFKERDQKVKNLNSWVLNDSEKNILKNGNVYLSKSILFF